MGFLPFCGENAGLEQEKWVLWSKNEGIYASR